MDSHEPFGSAPREDEAAFPARAGMDSYRRRSPGKHKHASFFFDDFSFLFLADLFDVCRSHAGPTAFEWPRTIPLARHD